MNKLIDLKDFVYYNRKAIITCLVVIVTIILYLIINGMYNDNFELENDITLDNLIIKENENTEVIEEQKEVLYVDVKGHVKNPGMYKMNINDRVIDAINMAGGLLPESDTSSINLSMKLKDEMVIIVSKKDDNKANQNENIYNDAKIESNSSNSEEISKISINKASVTELMKIKGLGEVKAQKIVEYRNKNGNFKSLEEIKNVSGIGSATYEKIKDYLTL